MRKITLIVVVALALLAVPAVASAAGANQANHSNHGKTCKKGFHRNGKKCVKNRRHSVSIPGPQGSVGPAGAPGTNGTDGTNGTNGTDGKEGPAGPTGPEGAAGPEGATGKEGPEGEKGDEGPQGPPAPTGLNAWGELVRNEYGSPTARVGNTSPVSPDGDGALILATSSGSEKAEFGTETEFAGKKISELTNVSFEEFITDDDYSLFNGNQPNIQMEVNPHVGSATYSSLVFDPGTINPLTQVNQWSTVDAAQTSNNGDTLYGWYFTNGTVATETGCGQNAGEHFCTLAEVQAEAPDAEVSLSLGLGKGRDYQFQGFVDNLEIFGATYDFTAHGVFKN